MQSAKGCPGFRVRGMAWGRGRTREAPTIDARVVGSSDGPLRRGRHGGRTLGDAIRGGDDWRTRIQTALEECRVGVIVIGEHWLDRDAKQQRRIDDEGDDVRKEIRTLLERNNRVIVVSAAGAPKMTPDVLPTDLRGLLNIQMLTEATVSTAIRLGIAS